MITFISCMFASGIGFYIGWYAGARQTFKNIYRAWKEIEDELRKI